MVQALAACDLAPALAAAPTTLGVALSHLLMTLRPVPRAPASLSRDRAKRLLWNLASEQVLDLLSATRTEFRAGGDQQDAHELQFALQDELVAAAGPESCMVDCHERFT